MSVFKRFFSQLRAWISGTFYFSDVDLFLAKQKKLQPILSLSQQQERLKHLRIQQLRDGCSTSHQERSPKRWDQF